MNMLCLAAEADPIGHVTIGRRPVSSTDLARLTGVSEQEVESLVAELERNGVFSRTSTGVIYSRRMVRDARVSAANSRNGKRGGNPNLMQGADKKEKKRSRLSDGIRPRIRDPLNPKANSQIPSPDGEGSGDAEPDPLAAKLWGPCLEWLLENSGRAEKECRSLIGKWRKKGERDGLLLSIFADCERRAISDPVAWIERQLNGKPVNGNGKLQPVGDNYRAEILAGLGLADEVDAGGGDMAGGGSTLDGDFERM